MFDRYDCINSKKYFLNFAKNGNKFDSIWFDDSIIVFFQKQVINWFKTVKKKLLKIANPCNNSMCTVLLMPGFVLI